MVAKSSKSSHTKHVISPWQISVNALLILIFDGMSFVVTIFRMRINLQNDVIDLVYKNVNLSMKCKCDFHFFFCRNSKGCSDSI